MLRMLVGDSRQRLKSLPDGCVDCCVTSPPYFGLRDYGVEGQMGAEQTPEQFVSELVELFREVRRVLRDDGTLWLNIGDSYAGSGKGAWANKNGGQKEIYIPDPKGLHSKTPKTFDGIKAKDIIGIPWLLAFALRADGWYLRQEIIWNKPNVMPENVKDRCTKATESIFLLSKKPKYHFDAAAIAEEVCGRVRGKALHADTKSTNGNSGLSRRPSKGKRNKRNVWTVNTKPFRDAHFATFPTELIEPCVKAGCRTGGVVLDPFGGAGTTAVVAEAHGRDSILCELNPEYAEMAIRRVLPQGIARSAALLGLHLEMLTEVISK